MPSCARAEIIRPEEVSVFHCWNRCVRRAFLCGKDQTSGIDYEYRRDWIRDMEEHLAGLFAIEIGFRGEMSNHLHLVLRTRPDVARTWSDEDVARRWLAVSKLAKSRDGQLREPNPARIALQRAIPGRIAVLRKRLSDPSWFMATLCEYVARRSNREDGCRGRFWEDRFQCRELLDESAILVCGIYVDLNQIRAGEALTPESSTRTSAYDRIRSRQQRASEVDRQEVATHPAGESTDNKLPDGWLCELTRDEQATVDAPEMLRSATRRRASDKGLLPISLDDYLALLDASGRIVRSDKAGAIPDHLAPILERLGIRRELWPDLVTRFDQMFGRVVGAAERVAQRAAQAGRRWYRGVTHCAAAFG